MAAYGGPNVTRPIVPILINANNKCCPSYALLDSGANISAISKNLVEKLNLKTDKINIKLGTFDSNEQVKKEVTSFKVSNLSKTIEFDVDNALIGNVMTTENEFPLRNEDIKGLEYMEDVLLDELEDDLVEVILSAKFAKFYFGKEIRSRDDDEPIAVLTDFGWCVIGPVDFRDYEHFHQINAISSDEYLKFDFLIRRMYRHDFLARPEEEFPPEMVHNSQYDNYSLQQMHDTITFIKEKFHFQVGIPWKFGREKTAEILSQVDFLSYARNRQRKLKEKLLKNPTLREGAFKQMQETIDLKHAEVLPDHSAPAGSPVCYLANHIVTRPDKPGKFRITQDAAAKMHGHCLNDYLITGPDVLSKLIGVFVEKRDGLEHDDAHPKANKRDAFKTYGS